MINQTAAANDAERAIVGAMLIDGRCIGDVLTAVREDDFLTAGMRAVFAAIRDLFLAGQAARLTRETPSFDFISGSAMTVADIRSLALARRYDVVMIDYVQLITPAGGREDRTQAMQAVSMELRAMAQLTGVTVIALAQLRRPETGSKPRAPTMADLKESGQFEQDADVVMLLYLNDADNRFSDRWLKIEKNKEGQAGQRCRLMFEGSKQRFVYRAPEDELHETKLKPVSEQLEIPFEEDVHADRR